MSVPVPCKGCIDRSPGCHSRCQKYEHFRTEYNKEKEYIRNQNSTPLIRFGSYLGDREILGHIAKRRKKSGKRTGR